MVAALTGTELRASLCAILACLYRPSASQLSAERSFGQHSGTSAWVQHRAVNVIVTATRARGHSEKVPSSRSDDAHSAHKALTAGISGTQINGPPDC